MPEPLPASDAQVVELLAARGDPPRVIAAESGVERTLVRQHLAEPAHLKRVAELREKLMSEVVEKLASIGGRAVETLEALLESEDEDVRLRAATTVLQNVTKFHGRDALMIAVKELADRVDQPLLNGKPYGELPEQVRMLIVRETAFVR